MLTKEAELAINECIYCGDAEALDRILDQWPEAIVNTDKTLSPTLLHKAVGQGKYDMVQVLIKRRADVNACPPPAQTALLTAISRGHVEIVHYLLAHGADVELCRPLIAAILRPPPRDLEFVRLLVDHGALINECYHPFDDKKQPQINPLSWSIAHGKHEIADYLRLKGATMPPGLQDPGPPTVADQIVAYFTEKLGPVQPLAQQEIVPTGLPIAIHLVPPSEGRSHITLFTTGMSEQPMNVPAGAETMQYAELAINLPADWPLPGAGSGKRSLFGWLGKGKSGKEPPGGALWPFQWLRTIARYPHENNTWLGGPAVIFANGDPPQPLSPGLPFTSFLLMSTDEVSCSDGRTVQIYQLIPLYTEERALEIAEGIPALLQALDRNNVSWVVDPQRPNVGKK